MAVVRWRPMRDIAGFQEEVNRLFDEFFGRVPAEGRTAPTIWAPPVDIIEKQDALVVKAELPGMSKDDLKINIEDNVLTIRGEKKQEKEEEGAQYHLAERVYGVFQRSFTLPASIDASKVKASYKDGVLVIEIPKKEEAKPKEIPIEVK